MQRFHAIFFIAIVLLPLLTSSFTFIDRAGNDYEYADNLEEEQGEEEETEKSEWRNSTQKFIISTHASLSAILGRLKHTSSHADHFLEIHSEVLTPPPEVV
jgi:hypothetical protein